MRLIRYGISYEKNMEKIFKHRINGVLSPFYVKKYGLHSIEEKELKHFLDNSIEVALRKNCDPNDLIKAV